MGASLKQLESLPRVIQNLENSRDAKLYKQLKNLKSSYEYMYEDLLRLTKIYKKLMIPQSELTKMYKENINLFNSSIKSFEQRLSGSERHMSLTMSEIKVNKKTKMVELQGRSCISGTQNSFISVRPTLPNTCVSDYDMMVRLDTEQINLMFKNLYEAKGGPEKDSGYFSFCINSKLTKKKAGESKIVPCANKNSGNRYEIRLDRPPQIITKDCEPSEPCGVKGQLKLSLKVVGSILGTTEIGQFIKKMDGKVLVNLNLTSDGKEALFTAKDIDLKSKFSFGMKDLVFALLTSGGSLTSQLSLNVFIRPLVTEIFKMLFLDIILNSSEKSISSGVDEQLNRFGFDIVEIHSIEGELSAFLKFRGGLFSSPSKMGAINKRKNFCKFIKAQGAK